MSKKKRSRRSKVRSNTIKNKEINEFTKEFNKTFEEVENDPKFLEKIKKGGFNPYRMLSEVLFHCENHDFLLGDSCIKMSKKLAENYFEENEDKIAFENILLFIESIYDRIKEQYIK